MVVMETSVGRELLKSAPSKVIDHAKALRPIFDRLDPNSSLSLRSVAAELTNEGVLTPTGAKTWTAATVARVRQRLAA